MLRARLATAAVAIPLLLLLIKYAPLWLFTAVVVAIAAVGVIEYFTMAFPAQPGSRAVGIAIGLAGALATTRVIDSLLFGVSAHDPATLAGVSATLLAVMLAAAYLPARRAMRVDPIVSLRTE